jgi:hypothetical protein
MKPANVAEVLERMHLQGEFARIVPVGLAHLQLVPGDRAVRRRTAEALSLLGDSEAASRVLLDGLSAATRGAVSTYSSKLHADLGLPPIGQGGPQLLPRGSGNVCIIDHGSDSTSRSYITKVTRGWTAPREHLFYRYASAHPDLKLVSPELLATSYSWPRRLGFLTIEKLRGRQPSRSDVQTVLHAHHLLEGFDPAEAPTPGPALQRRLDWLRRLAVWRTRRKIAAVETFAWLHEPDTRAELLIRLSRLATMGNWTEGMTEVLRRLCSVVQRVETIHLAAGAPTPTLVHGDFHLRNMVVDSDNGSVRFFDWQHFRVSHPRLDLMRLLADRFEYPTIEAQIRLWCSHRPLEAEVSEFLVLMALITHWLLEKPSRRRPDAEASLFNPALWRLEQLCGSICNPNGRTSR